MGALTRRRFARNLCLRPLRLAREAGGGGKMHRSTYRASPEYPDGSTIGPHISRHRRLQHTSSHISSTTKNLTAPVGRSALTACTVNVSSTRPHQHASARALHVHAIRHRRNAAIPRAPMDSTGFLGSRKALSAHASCEESPVAEVYAWCSWRVEMVVCGEEDVCVGEVVCRLRASMGRGPGRRRKALRTSFSLSPRYPSTTLAPLLNSQQDNPC